MGFFSEATQSSPLSFSQINDLPKGQEKTFCAKKGAIKLAKFSHINSVCSVEKIV